MSYKQFGLNKKDNKLFEKLKKEAIEKINITNQQLKSNEQEEEESSSSSESYYSDEDENSIDSELSSKKKNEDNSSRESKNINSPEKDNKSNTKKDFLSIDNNLSPSQIEGKNLKMGSEPFNPLNNTNENQNEINKDKSTNDDFYHVNFNKITYFVFNYQSGFVEVMKDQKFKISQVTKTINQEKENATKANPKFLASSK